MSNYPEEFQSTGVRGLFRLPLGEISCYHVPLMVRDILPEDVKVWLDEKRPIVLLDVREEYEVNYCQIDGSLHIPLGRVSESALEQLSTDREIVVYCHHGVRSRLGGQILERLGFTDVYNLAGGIEAWSTRIDPSIPRY